MDQSAGSKEEEGLEHGVGEEVEHACHVAETGVVDTLDGTVVGHTEAHHHEGDLRYGGECEHSLDVKLGAGNDGGIERRYCAYTCHERQRGIDNTIEGEHSGHEIDTGHNHGCGMDKGRHRGRTFHGVGKPDMQRHHRRLTHTSDKDEHHSPCER